MPGYAAEQLPVTPTLPSQPPHAHEAQRMAANIAELPDLLP